MTARVELARLARSPDAIRRPLYWRGPVTADPDGTGLLLPAGRTADLGTWFNAAPLAWWRSLVPGGQPELLVRGTGELTLTTIDPSGRQTQQRIEAGGGRPVRVSASNAVWGWLGWRAGAEPARLDTLTWVARTDLDVRVPRVTAVVPSYRRADDAVAQVHRLLAPELADVIARVILIDQGGTVVGRPDVAATADRAGDRLVLHSQANLGGSGGFARGMLDAMAYPDEAVLLLDDDAVVEPEGLRRMLAVSACCLAAGRPAIVGTPLFAADRPTTLIALAETVRAAGFRWGPADGLRAPVDLATSGPGEWPFARPDARPTYTGWWGTLLPAGSVGRLGLPAPYFLKWDDAEYGLRAGRAGYRMAVLPGTAVWHPSWAAKGTVSSWAAQPLHRNRLATAAGYRAGRSVLADSLVHQVKHVLSLQYGTADLWDDGLAQVLTGPGWLTEGWLTTRDQAERTVPAEPSGTLPPALRPAARPPAGQAPVGAGPFGRVRAAAKAALGLVRRNALHDVVAVPTPSYHWSDGLGRDAVIVAGSSGVAVRDPRRARRALRRTVLLHGRAALRWGDLSRQYGTALAAASTPQRWRAVFRAAATDAGPRQDDVTP